MMTDHAIRTAISSGLMDIDPLDDGCVEPASYDLRVGNEAFVSGANEKTSVDTKGWVVIEPGEFAVVNTRERVKCGPQVAGLLGLSSTYARKGLTLLSGPQIDPGFDGKLVVRMTNLSPNRVTLAYEAPFLTAQFFKLSRPVEHPYAGPRQGQTGLRPEDLDDLMTSDNMTLGGVVKSLASLARDVSELKTSVRWMARALPAIVAFGIAAITGIAALK